MQVIIYNIRLPYLFVEIWSAWKVQKLAILDSDMLVIKIAVKYISDHDVKCDLRFAMSISLVLYRISIVAGISISCCSICDKLRFALLSFRVVFNFF